MRLRLLCIFVSLGFVSPIHTINSFTTGIKHGYPSQITYLRGGDQIQISGAEGGEEKVEEKVAFVATKESQSNRIRNEINKNLKERFEDASISLQRLVELQKFKPMAMNFSNEIKLRYEELQKYTYGFKPMADQFRTRTTSKLHRLKLASMLKFRIIHEKLRQQCDAHLNYDLISQSVGSAKSWMKDGPIKAVVGSDATTGYILMATFLLSSLGSSLGFLSFLYFVSVGFGTSIGIIASSALILSNFYYKNPVPLLTNVHTGLTLLWSLRLISFLLHREYVNWPQWHDKLAEVDERANAQSRISIWVTCSLFYAMMMAPCINRMKEAVLGGKVTKWGNLGKTGICLQGGGLFLEALADFQKGRFKRIEGNRNRFCDKGIWNFFSHPNYLGEIIFWSGTFLGGVACNGTLSDWTISIVGLLFLLTVMKGACDSLDSKHIKNYGHDDYYWAFRRKRCFFGPNIIPSSIIPAKRRRGIARSS